MKCPFCFYQDTEVIETRHNEELMAVKRRRQCTKCQKRFTTMERVEDVNAMVIKKDGTREKYDTNKLKRGIIEACSKTRVDYAQIEKIIEEVTKKVYSKDPLEIDSYEIGKIVADELKKIDKVAYIRFASVFKEFMDVDDFKRELKQVK